MRRPLTAEELRERVNRNRREHPDEPTGLAARHDSTTVARWANLVTNAKTPALAKTITNVKMPTRDPFRRVQAAKDQSRAQLRRLPPDERRRVGRMSCKVGDAYLARRVDRRDHGRHLLEHGRHRRDPGDRPIRWRGSRRQSGSSPPSPDDPDEADLHLTRGLAGLVAPRLEAGR